MRRLAIARNTQQMAARRRLYKLERDKTKLSETEQSEEEVVENGRFESEGSERRVLN